MKLIYTNENKIIVDNVKNLLTLNEIPVQYKNEYLSAGAGELSPIDVWPELWVSREHYDAATTLIEQMESYTHSGPWYCRVCHEKNEPTFELCWNCQTDSEEE